MARTPQPLPKKDEYLAQLKERRRTSRVYKKNQLTGLALAEILSDEKHKSLYMKLAKGYNNETLIRIAKGIAERKGIRKKGAYFMRILHKEFKK